MKKLPIGISTFETIIKENYVYVDKTNEALELIENGQYYFLSRPRRFGKSLFLDTLRNIFEGKKELFKGLYIYDKWDWSKKYPVIRISFNDGNFKSVEGLNKTIYQILDFNQRYLQIECPKDFDMPGCFKRLIEEACYKYNQRVVILIDEYDKPILDNIENPELAKDMREELKTFYAVIKGADEYLKFAFMTGVSKFSKMSLFSGLNNLDDITTDKKYATICGYTHRDLETVFAEHLKGQDYEMIRKWYNGYKWLGEPVYNPFDILLFISKGYVYENYWFSTGTPTFLLKLIEKNNYFLPSFENIVKDKRMLDSFDVNYIDIETLMWQTGYLTIKDYEQTPFGVLYYLGIPNLEVQISLMSSISDYISKSNETPAIKQSIYLTLSRQNLNNFKTNLTSLYASIPYNLFTNNPMYEKEGYYVSIFYAYMKGMGVDVVGEDVTNKGRIDLTVIFPEAIYIMEFKVDGNDALKQLKDKRYYEKYTSHGKPIYLVGIEFDSKDRNVKKVEWEKVILFP